VLHQGSCFQAVRDTAAVPDGSTYDWQLIAAAGTDGRSLRITGTYSREKTYSELDIVTLNSSWFVARKNSPGACPGPDWQVGPSGKKGEQGARGDRGEPGPAGRNGRDALEWVGIKVDRKTFTITAVMEDGSEGPEMQFRELFDQYDLERRGLT